MMIFVREDGKINGYIFILKVYSVYGIGPLAVYLYL